MRGAVPRLNCWIVRFLAGKKVNEEGPGPLMRVAQAVSWVGFLIWGLRFQWSSVSGCRSCCVESGGSRRRRSRRWPGARSPGSPGWLLP